MTEYVSKLYAIRLSSRADARETDFSPSVETRISRCARNDTRGPHAIQFRYYDRASKARGKLPFVGILLVALTILPACNSEVLQKQAEQLKRQDEEIARQRQEMNALLTKQKLQEQQRRDCNRAFREFFDKAQAASDRDSAIALYREGLALCPDDDVAHYELGKILADGGRYEEAEKEFETALKINPGFDEAKKELDSVRK